MVHIFTSLYNLPIDKLVLLFLLVFTRVGGCIMLLPAFSSARVPMRVRLFLAIAFSLSITPLVEQQFLPLLKNITNGSLLVLICSETLIGALMGASIHVFFWTLTFMGTVISMCLGFRAERNFGVVDNSSSGSLENLMLMAALMLFFVTDMHVAVLKGLVSSYFSIKPSLSLDAKLALSDYLDALIASFNSLTRISAPFVMYSIIVNISIGLVNKLTPLIPIYFISSSAVMIGGLFLFYILLPELLNYFSLETLNWITRQM